jgi:predicted dehydrogenase
VLCDKPFGVNAEEARAMRDRAQSLGVLNYLNFELRSDPPRVRLKTLVDEGAIGAIEHVNWTFIGSGLRRRKHGWLTDREKGGGWIGAFGSHAIDFLRWLYGDELAECGGVMRTEVASRPDAEGVMHPSTAEDAYSVWFVTRAGRTASMDTAFSASVSFPQRIVVTGSEGALELVDERTLTLRRPRQDDIVETIAPPEGDVHMGGLMPWLAAVRESLRTGRQIQPSFDDGVATAEVMDAMRRNLVRLSGPR